LSYFQDLQLAQYPQHLPKFQTHNLDYSDIVDSDRIHYGMAVPVGSKNLLPPPAPNNMNKVESFTTFGNQGSFSQLPKQMPQYLNVHSGSRGQAMNRGLNGSSTDSSLNSVYKQASNMTPSPQLSISSKQAAIQNQ